MFVEVVVSKLLGCLTLVTKPVTQLHRALHVALSTTLQGREPSRSASTKERQASEEGAACSQTVFSGPNPQVFMPMRPWISISTVIAMCAMCRGLCVISGVLNDLCSMCYWVALPEISMGLTLKLSFILGRLQWAGPTSQDGDLTGLKESKAARSALFQMSS